MLSWTTKLVTCKAPPMFCDAVLQECKTYRTANSPLQALRLMEDTLTCAHEDAFLGPSVPSRVWLVDCIRSQHAHLCQQFFYKSRSQQPVTTRPLHLSQPSYIVSRNR